MCADALQHPIQAQTACLNSLLISDGEQASDKHQTVRTVCVETVTNCREGRCQRKSPEAIQIGTAQTICRDSRAKTCRRLSLVDAYLGTLLTTKSHPQLGQQGRHGDSTCFNRLPSRRKVRATHTHQEGADHNIGVSQLEIVDALAHN